MFAKIQIAAVLAATAMATPALAADPRVNIINNSGLTVTHIEMSGAGSEVWGPDLLGKYVMRSGYRLNMVQGSHSSGNCRYCLRVTFAGGRQIEIHDFNACATTDVTIHSGSFNLA
ncbi:hypothetical protein IP88_14365 [alpha proteobacterium AAP81b]|nr:hypothetical protein IP88_14365 [alpha proteobacterium AAP81b]